jgi:hypothetical protein
MSSLIYSFLWLNYGNFVATHAQFFFTLDNFPCEAIYNMQSNVQATISRGWYA